MTYEAGQIWRYNHDEEEFKDTIILVEFIDAEFENGLNIEDWTTYSLACNKFCRWRLYDNEEWTRLA